MRSFITASLLVFLSAQAYAQTVGGSRAQLSRPTLTQRPPPGSGEAIGSQAHVFIAFKGHVCTAIAYWVQGDTLHYITAQGSHNQVSLVLVDRPTSAKLNSGRLVKLILPPP